MTREEKIELLEKEKAYMLGHGGDRQAIALDAAIKALEQETVSKESYDHEYFLRKELEMKVEKLKRQLLEQESYVNIPFLLHREFGCSLDECKKAYKVAIDYLQSQAKVKG